MSKALKRRQRGQALTEFIVIALVLVPLLLLMPMIGKYQSITHATEMASRYAAFEVIANNPGMNSYKTKAQLEQEVRRRFFSNTDAPIKTNDEAGDFKANQNLFWVDPQGDALIRKFSDVAVSFGTARSANPEDGVSSAADGKPFNIPVPVQVADQMGVNTGMYTANVSVVLANLQELAGSYASTYEQFANINLSVTRHTSVVPDTWTASGPGQVDSRIDKTLLFPGSLIRPAAPLVKVAVNTIQMPACGGLPCLGSDKAPKLGELSFWDDEVPADRLK
jgi:hypothetical protein